MKSDLKERCLIYNIQVCTHSSFVSSWFDTFPFATNPGTPALSFLFRLKSKPLNGLEDILAVGEG